jgi:hypothetical protein
VRGQARGGDPAAPAGGASARRRSRRDERGRRATSSRTAIWSRPSPPPAALR